MNQKLALIALVFGISCSAYAAEEECGTLAPPALDQTPSTQPAKPGDSGGKPAAWLWDLWVPSADAQTAATQPVSDLEKRIKDCSRLPGSTKKTKAGGTWNLVTRKWDPKLKRMREAWRDAKTGLIWGEALPTKQAQYRAMVMDRRLNKVTGELACTDAEGQLAAVGIKEKSFGVPTASEFYWAEKSGIREVVPSFKGRQFWSKTMHQTNRDFAVVYDGTTGGFEDGAVDFDESIICVGR